MSNPRNLSVALLNAISPPSLTSHPSNNINEGPGTQATPVVTDIICGPLFFFAQPPTQPSRQRELMQFMAWGKKQSKHMFNKSGFVYFLVTITVAVY